MKIMRSISLHFNEVGSLFSSSLFFKLTNRWFDWASTRLPLEFFVLFLKTFWIVDFILSGNIDFILSQQIIPVRSARKVVLFLAIILADLR